MVYGIPAPVQTLDKSILANRGEITCKGLPEIDKGFQEIAAEVEAIAFSEKVYPEVAIAKSMRPIGSSDLELKLERKQHLRKCRKGLTRRILARDDLGMQPAEELRIGSPVPILGS